MTVTCRMVRTTQPTDRLRPTVCPDCGYNSPVIKDARTDESVCAACGEPREIDGDNQ